MTPEEEKKIQIERDNQEALSEAAVWLGDELKKRGDTYMLSEALTLTVKADKGYQKAAHTGGEDFKVVRGYHGKRDGAILVFTPVMASNYTEMEMPVSKAQESLSGMAEALREVGWSTRVKEIAAAKIKAREELANKERSQAYGNDYGGW